MVIYDEISESKNQILNHNIYDSQFLEPIEKNVTDDRWPTWDPKGKIYNPSCFSLREHPVLPLFIEKWQPEIHRLSQAFNSCFSQSEMSEPTLLSIC